MKLRNVEDHPMTPIFYIRRATGVWKQLMDADRLRCDTPDKIPVHNPSRKSTQFVSGQVYRTTAARMTLGVTRNKEA